MIDDLIKQLEEDIRRDTKEGLKEDLKQAFRSQEAKDSAKKINALFKENKMDVVSDPHFIAEQIQDESDGLSIELTENQRRFIAADQLYGGDSIGLKYTDD